MTPQRRLLVITELYPNVQNTFIGTFVRQQLLLLRKSFDITVITTHSIPFKKSFTVRQPFSIVDEGIKKYSIAYYPWWLSIFDLLRLVSPKNKVAINKRFTSRKIRRLARQLHRQQPFDLVHGHESYIGDEAGPIGKFLNIPSVFTLHGLYPYHLQCFGQLAMSQVVENLRTFSRYIAVSTMAADSYIQHGLPKSRFDIIPNGINLPIAVPPRMDIRKFAAERIVLLSVGFFTPEKRFDQTIRLLSTLPPTQAVLVIVGRGALERQLRRLAIDLGCQDRVLFLGEVRPADMNSIYASADILVHPSIVDSFSMVCLEAMSNGCPVVCCETIGITEFATNGREIITVPPDDQSKLALAVSTLMLDPHLRQQIRSAAMRLAANMTWDHQIEKITRIYDRLAVND